MPLIYQARCRACGHESPMWPADWLSVRTGPETEEVLPHPSEGHRLGELGLTWEEARRRDLLRSYSAVVCDRCTVVSGHAADASRLPTLPPRLSDRVRLAFIVFGAVGGALVAVTTVRLWWEKLIVGVVAGPTGAAVGATIWTWIERLVQRVWPTALTRRRTAVGEAPTQGAGPAREDSLRCSDCGEGHLHRLDVATQLALSCPACGEGAYELRAIGVS